MSPIRASAPANEVPVAANGSFACANAAFAPVDEPFVYTNAAFAPVDEPFVYTNAAFAPVDEPFAPADGAPPAILAAPLFRDGRPKERGFSRGWQAASQSRESTLSDARRTGGSAAFGAAGEQFAAGVRGGAEIVAAVGAATGTG